MKTKKIVNLLLLLFCAISFSSCLDNDEEDQKDLVKVQISEYTVTTGTLLGNWFIEGMNAKIGDSNYQFLSFGAIEDFTFNRGYRYELLVERTTLANPPADGSMYTYKLKKIISKEEVSSKITTTKLYVSSELGSFKYGDFTQDYPIVGMKYKENVDDDWTFGPFYHIEGFNYEEGYDYILTVEKIEPHNLIIFTNSTESSTSVLVPTTSETSATLSDISFNDNVYVQYRLISVDSKIKANNE